MRILLIGAFSFDKLDVGGQPVKSRELYYALKEKYGPSSLKCIETIGWKKRRIRIFFSIVLHFFKSDIVIMLPAQNGLSKFAKLLSFLKRMHRRTRIFYDVIGGWLPSALIENCSVQKHLASFNGIWVETESMRQSLQSLGLTRIEVIPNFRNEVVYFESLKFSDQIPHKLCIFSRVIREKGIGIAIDAVNIANKNGAFFCLDIYGPIDSSYEHEFYEEISKANGLVRYCGIKKPNDSQKTLSQYLALLFPTFYPGEGMAGTLVDALFAGCPIIASDWKYNKEIVNAKVGYIFKPISSDVLGRLLLDIHHDSRKILKMRQACLEEAQKYTRETNIEKIIFELEKSDDHCK